MMNQETCECKDCGRLFNRYMTEYGEERNKDDKCPHCESKNIKVIDIAF